MKNLLVLILIICSLLACKKSPDTSKFIGNWKGNYVGQDTGTFNFSIDANLKSTGNYNSRLTNETGSVNGRVTNDGGLLLHTSVLFGRSFSGSINGTTGSGTWFASGLCGGCIASGNWSCIKQ